MSIQSCAGAEAAAVEILSLVQEKLSENRDKPEAMAVLQAIKAKAEEIRALAKSGYY